MYIRNNISFYDNIHYFSGNIDLNRNFPKWYHHKAWELSDRRDDLIYYDRERETEILMKWIMDNAFALSVREAPKRAQNGGKIENSKISSSCQKCIIMCNVV